MALTVTLEFSDDELDYFRSQLRRIRARNGHRTPAEIAAAASAEVARLRATARSPFVLRRIDRVDRLIAMLEDPEWQLPEPERRGVLDGLAYASLTEPIIAARLAAKLPPAPPKAWVEEVVRATCPPRRA